MGELPHFISDVPEDTINKQRPLDIPQRIFTTILEDWSGVATERPIYTVPKGKVLEIRHLQLALSAGVTGNNFGRLFVSQGLGTPTEFEIMRINLDHQEHDHAEASLPPFSLLIPSGKEIRFQFSSALGSTMTAIIIGFLISRDELNKKTNIVI